MKYKIGDKFLNELVVSEINQEKAAPYFLSGGQGVGWWSEAALMDLCKYITGGWIPVEERLPVTDDGYAHIMVSMDDGFVCTTDYTDRDGFELWADSGEVIAWMPLPEPYKPLNLTYADNDTAQSGLQPAT